MMRREVRRAISVGLFVLVIAWGMWYDRMHPLPSASVAAASQGNASSTGSLLDLFVPKPAVPKAIPLSLPAQTKTAHCVAQGPLPDRACTPGAVFPSATAKEICVSGYSRSVRSVSVKTKRLIYLAYGLTYPQASGAYEADHFIPLELGGSNDVANLFPEAAAPVPGFHEKDLVENYLHNEVCAGRLPLTNAQQEIADNWVGVYESLSQDQLAALKAQAASYNN